MESFYGGPQGAGVVIKKSYYSISALQQDFLLQDCQVKVGEYGIITPVYDETVDAADSRNQYKFGEGAGNIYRRELDGSATFAGNLMGPQGPAAAWTLNGIAASITKAQYIEDEDVSVIIHLQFPGTTETETVTISVNAQDVQSTIESLNDNLTSTILLNHPMYIGFPFVISVSDITQSEAENYPVIYYIFDWSLGEWTYGGSFINIERQNIIGISNNEGSALQLFDTLVDGGINLYNYETDFTSLYDNGLQILQAQCPIDSTIYGG